MHSPFVVRQSQEQGAYLESHSLDLLPNVCRFGLNLDDLLESSLAYFFYQSLIFQRNNRYSYLEKVFNVEPLFNSPHSMELNQISSPGNP